MTQPNRILCLAVLAAAMALLPNEAAAQSGTVTDDAFLSTNSTTQQFNLNGQGISLIVAGSSATVGNSAVGSTKTYIKFQLLSSLPLQPPVLAANVAKATLKLYLSPLTKPSGAIDIYPVTGTWTETTLNPSSPPALAATAFATGIPVGQSNSFLVIDLTKLVQEWLETSANGGLDNDGIALVADTSTTYVVFDSKESIVTSHEPRLEIVLANSGPAGAAATVTVGTTTTLGPTGQANVSNGGTPNAAILNFSIPQGQPGATGQTGPAGQAATVTVGTVVPVPFGTPPSILTGGTPNAAVLNFLIPQGQPGAMGAQGLQGPVGINNRGMWNVKILYNPSDTVFDSGSSWLATQPNSNSEPSPTNTNWQLLAGGIVNRGVWSLDSSYNVNDVVFDTTSGSSWLALQAIPANTPNSEPSSTNTSWQLLAQQGAVGTPGSAATVQIGQVSTGASGTQASVSNGGSPTNALLNFTIPQGPMGMPGLPGPPGQNPVGAAITTQTNIFSTSQTINGSLILPNSGSGIQFSDGSLLTTATSSSGGSPVCFDTSGNGSVSCPIVISPSGTPPAGYIPLSVISSPTNTWAEVAPLPRTRFDLAAAGANNKVYAMGGDDSITPFFKQLFVYDSAKNTWQTSTACNGSSEPACSPGQIPNMPTARKNLAAAAGPVLSKIYAIGGQVATNTTRDFTGVIEAYDPVANRWETEFSSITNPSGLFPMPSPRTGLAAAAVDGKIYAIGGFGPDPVTRRNTTLATLEIYDPATNSWATGPSMPTARWRLAAAASNGKIYVMGGRYTNTDATGTTDQPLAVVEVFDTAIGTWAVAAPMPSPRYDFAAGALNGQVYAISGVYGLAAGGRLQDQDVDVYDPQSDTWHSTAPLFNAPRPNLAAATLGGNIYAVGGGKETDQYGGQPAFSYVRVCSTAGQSICGLSCVDTSSNVNNCGGCGIACPKPPANAAPVCSSGSCTGFSCNSGFSSCSSACVNLQTDANNCGVCGTACTGPTNTCVTGSCACPAPNAVCGGTCVNLQTDTNNCGACGSACMANQSCISGACACTGLVCNGACVNPNTDNNNCGACGNVCAAGYQCTSAFLPVPQCLGGPGAVCTQNNQCLSNVCLANTSPFTCR